MNGPYRLTARSQGRGGLETRRDRSKRYFLTGGKKEL
jgi:hypothetical protein